MSAEIHITVQVDKITPETTQALCALLQCTSAVDGVALGFAAPEAKQQPDSTPTPVAAMAAAPTAPTAEQTYAPPAPTVAPTSAPTYTLDQLVTAGAGLLDAGKMQDLVGLLAKYEVQALTQIKPEQYGALAADLRALGARL